MADYDNTNSGTLFPAEDKKSEKSPDFTGKLNVEGKEYRLSAWKKTSKAGKKFLSVSIQQPQQKSDAPAKQVAEDSDWGI
jgi:uncharacterized protein (DUF736 family)